jgi:hypothetical protein
MEWRSSFRLLEPFLEPWSIPEPALIGADHSTLPPIRKKEVHARHAAGSTVAGESRPGGVHVEDAAESDPKRKGA